MPFLFIAIFIAVIIILSIGSKGTYSDTKNPHDAFIEEYEKRREAERLEEEKIKPLSEQEVIDLLMTPIDKEIGQELLQKRSIQTLRSKIIKSIEKDYRADPKKISKFVQSIDYKLWALKMICDVTFRVLSTKKYFGENGITPTGQLYYELNKKCLQTAYDCGYMDKNEFDVSIRNLNELLYCAGDYSAFRYHEKDNWLDTDDYSEDE